MLKDSDCWIGHESCRRQIWAQDSDSWSEAAACQCLRGASSGRLRRYNLLVQGYHWWWELNLRFWPWDKATILPMKKSKLTETEKGKISEQQSQKHAHHFLWQQWDCSQRIRPGRPKSQFRILLWSFMATVWKCAKTSLRSLATKELVVASRQRTVSHFVFQQGIFDQKQHDCSPPLTLLAWLGPLRFFCFPDWR
jgi:hypothetical protein